MAYSQPLTFLLYFFSTFENSSKLQKRQFSNDSIEVEVRSNPLKPNSVPTKESSDKKGKDLFLPLRRAITGLSNGPELKNIILLMGYDKIKDRLSGK